jgi:L-cysteine desulfidase
MKYSDTLLIKILKKETHTTTGCTTLATVALAAARAKKALGRNPNQIEIILDTETFKAGMTAGIPGTKEVGIPWAAARLKPLK